MNVKCLPVLVAILGLSHSEGCGRPLVEPIMGRNDDRIVGGRIALPNSWPWQASLNKGKGHYCGGALISEQWILTAAHCVETLQVVNVTLGEHDLEKVDKGEMVASSAPQGIHVHPSYFRPNSTHDIALVKLQHPVAFNKALQPVCLPDSQVRIQSGEFVYVTGWGYTGILPLKSRYLKQAMVPVIDQPHCAKETVRPVPLNSICTGYPTGDHNPCQGDSGGPMVHLSGNSWHVHGIVSWGPADCGWTERPTVYVHVPIYIPWIRETMSNN